MEGFFLFFKKMFYFICMKTNAKHPLQEEKRKFTMVFGSKEMRFKPRPTTETFLHHVFGWAAIF